MKTSIETVMKFTERKTDEQGFTRCRCRVFRTGRNKNGSDITEEALKKFIDKKGWANVPVVAHLIKTDNSYRVGGHDERLTAKNGGFELVSECVPFGVIPEGCDPKIEDAEENGEKVKYFCADIILWTHRYPIMEAAEKGDVYFNQSMEAVFNDTETQNGIVRVKDLSLSALCLLGRENREQPCFDSSNVTKKTQSFTVSGFNSEANINASKRYGSLLDKYLN